MPFVFFIGLFIFIAVLSSRAKQAQKDAERQKQLQQLQGTKPGAPAQRPAMQQTVGRPQVFNVPQQSGAGRVYDDKTVITKPVRPAVTVEKSREQLSEEARQLVKAITGKSAEELKQMGSAQTARTSAQTARPTARQTATQAAKPVVKHADDDCGGGSIHDGYHEGVSGDPFGEHKGTAVAGNLGKKLGAEDDNKLRELYAAENARRAMARIAKLPPMAQGMVYSEILGKPKSELS